MIILVYLSENVITLMNYPNYGVKMVLILFFKHLKYVYKQCFNGCKLV